MVRHIIVHIGTGKTGSTAIQRHLSSRKVSLPELNVSFWGLNLEHCTTKTKYSWQQPSGIGLLQRMSEAKAKEELAVVLEEALSENADLAIWSNESIYERPGVYVPLLRGLIDRGLCSITIIAYVRSIRGYIHSAYKQWGIKHKTYSGEILGFTDWIKTNVEFLSYGSKLAHWDQAFSTDLQVYNYDVVGDVLHHFMSLIPHCKSIVPQKSDNRENASPSEIQLALYALYNNQFAEPVLPHAITSLLRRYKLDHDRFEVTPLSSLYPSANEIESAQVLLEDQADIVNRILERNGQPALLAKQEISGINAASESDISRGVLSLLTNIVVQQELRINHLETQIKKLG